MMDAQFADAVADRLTITEVAGPGVLDTRQNTSFGHDISQTIDPSGGFFSQENRVHSPANCSRLATYRLNPSAFIAADKPIRLFS